jgi:hypothetical protein
MYEILVDLLVGQGRYENTQTRPFILFVVDSKELHATHTHSSGKTGLLCFVSMTNGWVVEEHQERHGTI